MSYQVIALKWRPKTFDRMIGQNHIGQTLINALKNGRLPQALLFTGPRGTGKTSSARILAKSLRCLTSSVDAQTASHAQPKDFVPCGTCSECIDISAGRSLDVVEIDGASNNGVDSIRELRDSVSFRPTVGSKKVYIIDEVHMLSISAFNALLKTLEEPPDHVVFILATTEVHKIPKTILSRCHRFDFRKVSTQEVTEHLEFICREEKVEFEKEALWSIARQGEGSVRDAFSFLDQVITYTGGKLTYDSVIESLGLTDRRLLTTIMSDIVGANSADLLSHMEDIFKSGADVGVFAEDFLEQIKNLLIVKSAPDAKKYLDLPDSEIQILKTISEAITEGHIHLLFDMMLEVTQNLMRTQDQRTVLEVGLLKLCLYPKVFDTKPLVSGAGGPAANVNSSPRSAPTQRPSASSALSAARAKLNAGDVNKTQPAAPTQNLQAKPEVATPARSSVAEAILARPRPDFSNRPNPSAQAQEPVAETPAVEVQASPGSSGLTYSEEKDAAILTEEQQKWHDFVAKVNRLNAKMGAILQNCTYDLKGINVWVGASEKMTFIKKDLAKPEFQKVLANYIKTFLGPDYVLKLEQPDTVEAPPPEVHDEKTVVKEQEDMTAEEKRRLMEKIHNSEAIQKLKKTFKDIEIVAIKEIES